MYSFRNLCRLAVALISVSLLLSPLSAAQSLPGDTICLDRYLNFSQSMTAQGWSEEESAQLWARFWPEDSASLLSQPYTPALAKLVLQTAFRPQLLTRYLDGAANRPELEDESLVRWVNTGLDRPFYQESETVAVPAALDVLVNKYHCLPADFVPELIPLAWPYASGSNQLLTPQAAQAFISMADGARLAGLTLRSVSAYRSYRTQASVYARYVRQDGKTEADTYSARPGWSEHQTGLALDINVADTSAGFEYTAEYAWLSQHCWEYGFLLRYPQGAQDRTGFTFEPWHYRYVGVETAQAVRASGLTYDEFVASRPASSSPDPVVLFQGQALSLSCTPVAVGGRLFLRVDDALSAMGRVDSTLASTQLLTVITAAASPEEEEIRHYDPTLTPLWLGDALYLPLDELAQLLGDATLTTGQALTVSPATQTTDGT